MASKKITRTSAIGLDFGTTAIRAAQVHYRRGQIEVIHVVQAELHHVAHQDTTCAVDTLLLKQSLASAGFRGKKVVLGLSSPEAEFHALDITTQVEDEMSQAIMDETLRLANNVTDKMETNYWMLPDTPVPVPNVMSVATPTMCVERALQTCDRAGYTCKCVDVAPTALGRMVDVLRDWPASLIWGVLDIGHRQSQLIIYVDHIPVLVRRVGAGVASWVDRIASALGVSDSTAYIQLFDHGVALSTRGGSHSSKTVDDKLSSIIGGHMRRDLHDLSSEVGRSYEYILSSFPKREAGDLVLVGRGACVQGVPEYLTQGLGIKVRQAADYLNQSGCRLTYSRGKNLSLEMFGLAVGLALEDEYIHDPN